MLVRHVDETPKYTQPSPSYQALNSTPDVSVSPQTPRSSGSLPRPTSASTPGNRSRFHLPTHTLQTHTLQGGTSLHHVPWPRISTRDACLLRYFTEDLSRWFDLTDPQRHFATAIPQRARECSTLLDAILAVSARHFSTLPEHQKLHLINAYGLTQTQIQDLNITEETVIHYHNKCITELRILADEPGAVMDENLLAAVVVLRFFEELDNPFINPPTETALHGLHVFLRAQASSALSSPPGPRKAAFWIGFRQEFNLAFSQQRTIQLSLSIASSYLTFEDAPDHIWTNRLIVIGTYVLEFCYGDGDVNGDTNKDGGGDRGQRSEYTELVALRDKWVENRPRSFSPIYVEPSSDAHLFPRIWYMDDCHIVAGQVLGMLDILFTAYSPHIPRIGPARLECLEAVDARIRATVLEMCGMALSNQQSRPAGLTACIAINICADRFTDAREQRALMELVVSTTQDSNYWPTTESQATLRAAWRWDDGG
ncbi:uncharacterized protein APUU_20494S [Aspergillus puulaauensis]|uniref:Uncharacterized protein n=1 Tax=Aspergillus puulaauensis TaxID=1220207 RepID=A0A7R7XEQ1_9EURO|nr:uncharacterized protein APUU_20494S [Aspergillus puulaauensis]BCS20062.1 hypothetical protein APUU_20494S [Aspergillus puulaauensis]